MAKQKKIVVPPREDRLDEMGNPKPPKMGGVTPTKIKVPEVDDLLDKLKKVTSKELNTPLTVPLTLDIGELWMKPDTESRVTRNGAKEYGHCHINCKCPPCQAGYCSRCTAALRNAPQNTDIRRVIYG